MWFVIILFCQSWSAYIDSTLPYLGITRADLAIRSDYTKSRAMCLPIIDSLLRHPLNSVDFCLSLEARFWGTDECSFLKYLSGLYGIKPAAGKGSAELVDQLIKTSFSGVPEDLGRVFTELTRFSAQPTGSIEEEFADLEAYDSLITRLTENSQKVDYEKLFRAGIVLFSIIDEFSRPQFETARQAFDIEGVEGKVLYYEKCDYGEIVIGDTGANLYKRDFAVILDLGGNDTYRVGPACSRLHLLIDKAGNDLYQGDDYSLACGNFGVSILIDESGDDIYQAKNYSIGCGVFGIGILIDKAGDDRYIGESFTQGAAGFGIGILKDEAGQDIYEAASYAQGFATTYGIGILADQKGNDIYLITKKFLDEIRYLDHYLSLAQGFSIGFRPDLAAGIGMILEKEGNDYYLADIFAQGSSYWYGLGAIVDGQGNDDYVAYQYAQGCGTHITLGLLIDKDGDDNYQSKGVSQGCGHDLALGLLLDRRGSDSYTAFDLSQGAGNANGIGILIDETGNDNYSVRRGENTQGYGDFRREYGSVGMLIDIRGVDVYYQGRDRSLWLNGECGIGIDWQ